MLQVQHRLSTPLIQTFLDTQQQIFLIEKSLSIHPLWCCNNKTPPVEIDGSPSLRKSFYLLNGSNKFLSFLKELKVNKVIPQTPAHVNGRPSLSNPLSPPRACQYLSWETLTQQAVNNRHLSFFCGSIIMKQFTDAKELCGDILIAAFSLLCKYNER